MKTWRATPPKAASQVYKLTILCGISVCLSVCMWVRRLRANAAEIRETKKSFFAYGTWKGFEKKIFQKNPRRVGFCVENVRRGRAIFDRFSAFFGKKKVCLFVCAVF